MTRLKPRFLQPSHISEFSGRQTGLVSKDIGDGPISSPIWQPLPPVRPPLGLMLVPRRARVTGVFSAHHEEVGLGFRVLGFRVLGFRV